MAKKTKYYKAVDIVSEKILATMTGHFICDTCKNSFNAKETLMEKSNNIEFQGILGIKGITKGKNTYYLVSPCCKETHLYGFDKL